MSSSKRTTIVDANIILRYLLKDHEELYKKAEEIFNDALMGKRKLLILQPVIAEVVYVLQKLYKVERKEISEVLRELLKFKTIKVNDKEVIIQALEIFAKKNLDFVDCILCAYSGKYSVETFDKGLKKCINQK